MNVYSLDELIVKAKEVVENNYGPDKNRKWVVCRAVCPGWLDGSQDIELQMWEGSPAKGFIIINYGRRQVHAFSGSGKYLARYHVFGGRIKK